MSFFIMNVIFFIFSIFTQDSVSLESFFSLLFVSAAIFGVLILSIWSGHKKRLTEAEKLNVQLQEALLSKTAAPISVTLLKQSPSSLVTFWLQGRSFRLAQDKNNKTYPVIFGRQSEKDESGLLYSISGSENNAKPVFVFVPQTT